MPWVLPAAAASGLVGAWTETFTMGITRMKSPADRPNRAGFPPYFRGFRQGTAAILSVRPATVTAPVSLAGPSFGDNMTLPVNALTSALQQMQSMATQAAGGTAPVADPSGAATGGDFGSLLKASINKISNDQQAAAGEAKAFELGASNVSLNDVMVDMQKAGIGFQFGLQVRNKLVSAYNEIMQMSV